MPCHVPCRISKDRLVELNIWPSGYPRDRLVRLAVRLSRVPFLSRLRSFVQIRAETAADPAGSARLPEYSVLSAARSLATTIQAGKEGKPQGPKRASVCCDIGTAGGQENRRMLARDSNSRCRPLPLKEAGIFEKGAVEDVIGSRLGQWAFVHR